MTAIYSHSRAAILCFGGWGLQTMLHLQPRLRDAQDRRAAINALGPDLTRIVNFAALLPEPLLDEQNRARFTLRQLRADAQVEPFHVEKVLDQIAHEPASRTRSENALLSSAEKRATALLHAVATDLVTLGYDLSPAGNVFHAEASGVSNRAYRLIEPESDLRHATRADIFLAAVEHADPVARLLETNLIDPIREDSVSPDDPFVQTVLYVVAPLFEPLAAALIWPIVAQVMARLGRRNIAQVVGIFASGSYAGDVTRAVENAAVYAALSEIEVLTGLSHEGPGRQELASLIEGTGSPLTRLVGESLFDTIYLLDREKSNQGLAHDSHELAVLAGNALEALIVADGSQFIQEQIGIGLHPLNRQYVEAQPYSLIGAATDYVPLTQVLGEVSRHEGRRIAREWALRTTPKEAVSHNPLTKAAIRHGDHVPSLVELGLTETTAVQQLVARAPNFYSNPRAEMITELQVDPSFILSRGMATSLRRTPTARWPQAFENHLLELQEYVNLAMSRTAIDEIWGLSSSPTDGNGNGAEPGADERLLPAITTGMQEVLLEMMAGSPTGILRAREQVARWQEELTHLRQTHQRHGSPEDHQLTQAQHKLARLEWEMQYRQAASQSPRWWLVLLTIIGAIAVAAAATAGYLYTVDRAWQMTTDGPALAGFAGLVLVVALFVYRRGAMRVRRLRLARVELVQKEWTSRLRAEVRHGLSRLCGRLEMQLRTLDRMLAEAEVELSRSEDEESVMAFLPPTAYTTYLYQPQVSRALWRKCTSYLHDQVEKRGVENIERLSGLWGTRVWREELRHLLAGVFRGPGAISSPDRSPVHAIARFIRRTVNEAVMPVDISAPQLDTGAINVERATLVRKLAQEFSLEHLLWRRQSEAEQMEQYLREIAVSGGELPREPQAVQAAERTFASKHQYVESAWNRAKPTANYDVVDRLATRGAKVEFATVSGDADSDLSRALLDEFGVTLLPTQDPFSITFVRTVHGLAMDDLESIHRYKAELSHLSPDERALVLLTSDPSDGVYRYRRDMLSFVGEFDPEPES